MSPMKPALPSPDVDLVLSRLREVRDVLALQAHLLSMGARDGVDALADALADLARRIEAAPRPRDGQGELALQAHLAWMEARDRFAALEPALERAFAAVRSAPRGALHAPPFEGARLQATLLAMDARDAVEARRSEAARDLARAKRRAEEALGELRLKLEPYARSAGTFA